jgi:hypothetical protein
LIFILFPGIIPGLSEPVLYLILYATIVHLTLPSNNYQPYKPRARWKKQLNKWYYKHIEIPLTHQISFLSSKVYLYLQDDKKQELNRNIGHQKTTTIGQCEPGYFYFNSWLQATKMFWAPRFASNKDHFQASFIHPISTLNLPSVCMQINLQKRNLEMFSLMQTFLKYL